MTSSYQNSTDYGEQIYRIIDSFLVEAKNQHGEDRSLERLNTDRHLAAKELTALLQQVELYGRLHETIEAFQSGSISAAVYSLRHDDIMDKLQSKQETIK